MRLIYILTLSLAVAACVSTPHRERWLAACETRAATVRSLTTLRQAGQLSPDTTKDVTGLVLMTRGICTGETPPTTSEALMLLESNIMQLVKIEGAAHVQPAN
jgi:hypothetical protein